MQLQVPLCVYMYLPIPLNLFFLLSLKKKLSLTLAMCRILYQIFTSFEASLQKNPQQNFFPLVKVSRESKIGLTLGCRAP